MAFSPQTALELLGRAHGNGRLAHAYLITGEAGSGKRVLAWGLARRVLRLEEGAGAALHPDIHTVEPESKSRLIRVEQTRELEKALQMRASQGGRDGMKIGLLFDAERMNASASNSFLKTLEEPPPHSLLMLVTAHPEMLLDTILSRCILVPLAAPARREPPPQQRRLLDLLARFFQKPDPALGAVFALVREFTLLLGEAKTAAQQQTGDELDQEEARYSQTTDGKWLEEREEHFKALAEARYLQERAAFIETLLQWWGDALRHQHGSDALDFPAYAEATAALAGRFPTAELLNRVSALEALRENFNRNVQEQLAIEVAFLKAFGGR